MALELFLKNLPRIPGKTDPDVIALSNLLQTLPFHSHGDRKQRFRNPAGVAFKLLNLNAARTGKGLTNISKLDRELWRAYGTSPVQVIGFAQAIRSAAATLSVSETLAANIEDFEAAEGRILGRMHRTRERARGLRPALLARVLKQAGKVQCEACDFVVNGDLSEVADSAFEVHHLRPLHLAAGETKTRLSDVVLLCAICHRLIHRVSSDSGEWQALSSFRKMCRSIGE